MYSLDCWKASEDPEFSDTPRNGKFFKAVEPFSEFEAGDKSGDFETKIFFNDSFFGLSWLD